MLHDKVILVVGGDLRQAQLAKLLSDRNTVYTMGLEKAEGLDDKDISASDAQLSQVHFDYIVFPMPVGSDGETVNTPFSAKRLRIDDALSFAEAGTYILGGKLSPDFCRKLEEQGLGYTDYFLREELSVLNAIPVAVSAVVLRMMLTLSREMSFHILSSSINRPDRKTAGRAKFRCTGIKFKQRALSIRLMKNNPRQNLAGDCLFL